MSKIQKILGVVIICIFIAGVANASLGQYWKTVDDIIPRTDDTSSIGLSTKKVKKLWVEDIAFYGELLPDGVICSAGEILKRTGADDWDCAADATGAGGSAIVLDIGDDGGDDSTDLSEIAITGDTNSIFTESAADKLLIAVGNDWPKADTSDDLTCTNCINATEIEDIYLLNNADDSTAHILTVATLNVNSAYVFPNADGNANEVLQTDGSGLLSWAAAGAGDITDVGNCASGACFIGTDSILDIASDANKDFLTFTNIVEGDVLSVASNGSISLNPFSYTGIGNRLFNINPTEVLEAEEHITLLRLTGENLDPNGADTRIRGLAINLGGVDITNVPESIEALRLVMPSGLTGPARAAGDALHITEGDIQHDFSVSATAGESFTAYDMIIDSGNLHANSEIHAFDISTSNGVPSGEIAAIGVHSYVSPVHQRIGTYTTPSQTEYAGEKTGGGSTWADGVDGSEIFVQNSDEVYIGSATQFSEISVIMGVEGTKTVTPTFWYNTAADTWTQFYPADATDGFIQSGLIHWNVDDISGSWTNDGDPGGGDSSTGYWIKIIRTAGPDPGTPTPTTVKTGTTTLWSWDENGVLTIASITVNNAYSFPNVDGASGEFITSDGSGNLSWLDATTEIDSAIATHAGDNDAHHALVTLTGQDYLTLSTQQITVGEIEPDDLANSDFGDFSCNGTN